ncbi:Cytochrome P450 CYP3, partial [Hyalella azteca]
QPIIVPVWSIHRDPANWPDPLSFNPERFLPHNKKDIKPFTFMPFGVGPRSCVGLRFAELAVKEGLISVVSQFVLSPCKGHSVHPPPIHSKIFTLKTDNLLPLHFAPITDLNSVIRHEHEQYPPSATEDPATRELLASIRDDKFPAL